MAEFPIPVWLRVIRWPDDDVQPGELYEWRQVDGRWEGFVRASREWVPGMPMAPYEGWVPASRISKRE